MIIDALIVLSGVLVILAFAWLVGYLYSKIKD